MCPAEIPMPNDPPEAVDWGPVCTAGERAFNRDVFTEEQCNAVLSIVCQALRAYHERPTPPGTPAAGYVGPDGVGHWAGTMQPSPEMLARFAHPGLAVCGGAVPMVQTVHRIHGYFDRDGSWHETAEVVHHEEVKQPPEPAPAVERSPCVHCDKPFDAHNRQTESCQASNGGYVQTYWTPDPAPALRARVAELEDQLAAAQQSIPTETWRIADARLEKVKAELAAAQKQVELGKQFKARARDEAVKFQELAREANARAEKAEAERDALRILLDTAKAELSEARAEVTRLAPLRALADRFHLYHEVSMQEVERLLSTYRTAAEKQEKSDNGQ